MVANLLRNVSILLVWSTVLKGFTLQSQRKARQMLAALGMREPLTNIGLNGFAIRPMVDE